MNSKRKQQTDLSYRVTFYGMLAIGVLMVVLFLAKTFAQ